MAKAPSFGDAFVGRWHIFERTTGQHLSRSSRRGAISRSRASPDGEIVFTALKGFLDVRYERETVRPARVLMGRHDEIDPVRGREWVMISTAARLLGHFCRHNGNDSGIVCERCRVLQWPARGN